MKSSIKITCVCLLAITTTIPVASATKTSPPGTVNPCVAEQNRERARDTEMRALATRIKNNFTTRNAQGALNEVGAFVVKTPSGGFTSTAPVEGTTGQINPFRLLASLAPLYTVDDVVGFVHSHPSDFDRSAFDPAADDDQDSVNRSPSDGDFGFIQAGLEAALRPTTNLNTWRADFSHYIIGPDNTRIGENRDLREFDLETRRSGPVFISGTYFPTKSFYVPSNIRISTGGFLLTMSKFYAGTTKSDAAGVC